MIPPKLRLYSTAIVPAECGNDTCKAGDSPPPRDAIGPARTENAIEECAYAAAAMTGEPSRVGYVTLPPSTEDVNGRFILDPFYGPLAGSAASSCASSSFR